MTEGHGLESTKSGKDSYGKAKAERKRRKQDNSLY